MSDFHSLVSLPYAQWDLLLKVLMMQVRLPSLTVVMQSRYMEYQLNPIHPVRNSLKKQKPCATV